MNAGTSLLLSGEVVGKMTEHRLYLLETSYVHGEMEEHMTSKLKSMSPPKALSSSLFLAAYLTFESSG